MNQTTDPMRSLRTVDNLHLIQPLLTFRDDDDFYMLDVMQRRKDGADLPTAAGRVLRRYRVNSLEYLDKRWDEIRGMCEAFQARAMIRLNVRSYALTTVWALQGLAQAIANKHMRTANAWDKAAGNHHAAETPTWILDIDWEEDDTPHRRAAIIGMMKQAVADAPPVEPPVKFIAEIPSKTGVHLLVRPFDLRAFRTAFPMVSVHKDNPTNLYIP